MLSVTKRFKFDAAHFLPNYVGKCASLHGHTWHLEVTVARSDGDMDGRIGMVMDFGILKEVVNFILDKHFDHKCLNDIIHNPTAENIIIFIAGELDKSFQALSSYEVSLIGLKLWETENSFVIWRKED